MRLKLKHLACQARAHCRACRTDPDWRERATGVAAFPCPHGVMADNIPEPRTPAPRKPTTLSEGDIRLAEQRAAVCEGCEHNRGVRRAVNGFNLYRVRCAVCKTCGGGGISLVHARCRQGKWPAD